MIPKLISKLDAFPLDTLEDLLMYYVCVCLFPEALGQEVSQKNIYLLSLVRLETWLREKGAISK